MPYVKKESIPCIDRRPCKYRDGRGICSLLTTQYLKNGRCPWCKADEDKPTKKPELSPGEIVDRYLNLKPTERHAPSCIFYQGADRRLCRATSNPTASSMPALSAERIPTRRILSSTVLGMS